MSSRLDLCVNWEDSIFWPEPDLLSCPLSPRSGARACPKVRAQASTDTDISSLLTLWHLRPRLLGEKTDRGLVCRTRGPSVGSRGPGAPQEPAAPPLEPDLEGKEAQAGDGLRALFSSAASSHHHSRCQGRLLMVPLWRCHVSIASPWVLVTAPLTRPSGALSDP